MGFRIAAVGLHRPGPPDGGAGARHGELSELRQHGQIVDVDGRGHEQKENMETVVCQTFVQGAGPATAFHPTQT
jgi:hypothetical protein